VPAAMLIAPSVRNFVPDCRNKIHGNELVAWRCKHCVSQTRHTAEQQIQSGKYAGAPDDCS
jgi:hypothetical protein